MIDTNAVIDYLGKKLPLDGLTFLDQIIDQIPIISVITKIEVLGFNASDEHYQILTDFMNDASILNLSNHIVDASIEIRKNYKTKLPDAIIAATAIVHGLTLISRNVSDFNKIKGLQILDPHVS